MEVLLANPRGFCAGVDRAIEIVERALELFGAPVYVRHQVVHNRAVVDGLRARGAVFVEELDEVPAGAVAVFSAHGVAPEVEAEAARRGLQALDATCPLVTKVHLEVLRFVRAGRPVALIGHAGHPEVAGTLGRGRAAGGTMHLVESEADAERLAAPPGAPLAYVTQTTLSLDDTRRIVDVLARRYPRLEGPAKSDICYATQNRQNAVRRLAAACGRVLVVGSPNSSNSNRLVEIARAAGAAAHLIDGPEEIRDEWLEGAAAVGVTAGASAPESLVRAVVARLEERGARAARELPGEAERVVFRLPRELQRGGSGFEDRGEHGVGQNGQADQDGEQSVRHDRGVS